MMGKKICPACGLDQSRNKECGMQKIRLDGIGYHRIRYGSSDEGFGPAVGKCMGCEVKPGRYHHWNCPFELCPVCREQMIGCKCEKEFML